jgi:integrase
MPRGKTKDRDGVYRRKDRPGFWASWIDANGKRRQRKLEAHTLVQARALLNAEKAAVEKATTLGYAPPSKETFEAVSERFLAFQVARLTLRAYQREEGILHNQIRAFFSRMKVADIRRNDIERYITLRSGIVSAGSVVKEMNILKHCLSKAVAWELIPVNPAHGVKLPKVSEGRTKYLSPTEFKAALEAAPDWMRAPMALAAFTGMRRGEILNLRWKDIDLAHQRVYLRETKNGTLRVLTLNQLAMQVLQSLPVGDPGMLVLPDVDPARLSVYTRRVFASVGIADASFHSLRHTAASWLVMEGVDLYAVGQILGHKTPRMTQRYAHLSPGYMAVAVGKLDGVFAGSLPEPKAGEVRVLSLP